MKTFEELILKAVSNMFYNSSSKFELLNRSFYNNMFVIALVYIVVIFLHYWNFCICVSVYNKELGKDIFFTFYIHVIIFTSRLVQFYIYSRFHMLINVLYRIFYLFYLVNFPYISYIINHAFKDVSTLTLWTQIRTKTLAHKNFGSAK